MPLPTTDDDNTSRAQAALMQVEGPTDRAKATPSNSPANRAAYGAATPHARGLARINKANPGAGDEEGGQSRISQVEPETKNEPGDISMWTSTPRLVGIMVVITTILFALYQVFHDRFAAPATATIVIGLQVLGIVLLMAFYERWRSGADEQAIRYWDGAVIMAILTLTWLYVWEPAQAERSALLERTGARSRIEAFCANEKARDDFVGLAACSRSQEKAFLASGPPWTGD